MRGSHTVHVLRARQDYKLTSLDALRVASQGMRIVDLQYCSKRK